MDIRTSYCRCGTVLGILDICLGLFFEQSSSLIGSPGRVSTIFEPQGWPSRFAVIASGGGAVNSAAYLYLQFSALEIYRQHLSPISGAHK